ncbi:MAG: response regulator [Candidatus Aminicenantales bacterium]
MKYKLIVADGSPSVQKVVELSFPASDFEIFSFDDTNEVIENISRIEPDAILLSLSLPGKDVYEVAFFLRNHRELNKIPIFLLRGAFESIDYQKVASIDYDEIVNKPFDSVKLARKVREAIERKRSPVTFPEEPFPEESVSAHEEGEEKEKRVGDVEKLIAQRMREAERNLEKSLKEELRQELREELRKELEELRKRKVKIPSGSEEKLLK